MFPETSSLQAFLATLGPWGVVLGFFLPIVLPKILDRLGVKNPFPVAPATPKPSDPAIPPVSIPNRPILSGLLALLALLQQKGAMEHDEKAIAGTLAAALTAAASTPPIPAEPTIPK